MNQIENIEDIEREISELKDKKQILRKENKMEKAIEGRKLRLKSNGNGETNVGTRVSVNFKRILIVGINEGRKKNSLDFISGPKISELILRHNLWPKIFQDLCCYNTKKEKPEVLINAK